MYRINNTSIESLETYGKKSYSRKNNTKFELLKSSILNYFKIGNYLRKYNKPCCAQSWTTALERTLNACLW